MAVALFTFDQKLRKKHPNILGIDEVGIGAIAGPLVVCGVILPPFYFANTIQDSKQIKDLTQRQIISQTIKQQAICYMLHVFYPVVIDAKGAGWCLQTGFATIAKTLSAHYDLCLTDYRHIPNLSKPQQNLVKGDQVSYTIACAAIVAKAARDEIMADLAHQHPLFQFTKNQGYPTKQHQAVLQKTKPIEGVHRYSYQTVKSFL